MDGEAAHRIVDHHIAAWTCIWSSEDTLESLGLDSLNTLDLLFQVSRESGINLSDLEKREGLRVKDILDALRCRQPVTEQMESQQTIRVVEVIPGESWKCKPVVYEGNPDA